MVKITKLSPDTYEQLPEERAIAPSIIPPVYHDLSFTLASGLKALFRAPTVKDLKNAESKPYSTQIKDGMSVATPTFYRELGRAICVGWGKAKAIPETIRKDDDQKLYTYFFELINADYPKNFDEAGGWRELTDKATESEAGDLFVPRACTLTNGDELVFRQVLSKDVEALEKASSMTSVEQYCKLASQVCTSWGGEAINWVESQSRFNSLDAEDYVRVFLTLKSF